MAEKQTAWSNAEVAATVRSYLEMLRREVSGTPYVKSEFRKSLLPLLSKRSESAIEFKHQNISAVLLKLGLRPIQGYQPAKNYQQSLVPEVQQQLSSSPSLVELILAEALRAPDRTIDGALDFTSANTPTIIFPEHSGSSHTRIGSPDYAAIEARNRALGLAGVLAVADLEYRRLVKAGKNKLASRIDHVSQTLGDGPGFDILSFEESGKERLIEVKTTRSRAETPFFVSRNELKVSKEHANNYHLVRVFNFGHVPGWFPLSSSLDTSCVLEPNDFIALPRSA
ncbi:protein NO VEIN domain-containing protein [Arthrobacter sp. RHLT1-20]